MKAEFLDDGRVLISREDFLKYFNKEAEQTPITGVPKETALTLRITDTLSNLGIPRKIKGYEFLRKAITLTIRDRGYIDAMTKALYPQIAREYNTLPSRVERAIRHAIEVGCGNKPEEMGIYFARAMDTPSGKPTNGEFIATVADELQLRKAL